MQTMLKEVQFITQEVTMSGIKALGPDEVLAARKASLPDVVIEVFNDLISENFNGHSAIVYQSAVVKHLVSKGLSRDKIYNKGWLDVEDIYLEQGWKVEYDKPGYNEDYEAYFKFSKK